MDKLELYHPWNLEALSLFEMMHSTNQSPIHHAEGNVYIHTQMVVEEVKKNFGLTAESLMYTAHLHDIAKPLTTTIEVTHVRGNQHCKLPAWFKKLGGKCIVKIDQNYGMNYNYSYGKGKNTGAHLDEDYGEDMGF